MATVLVLPSLPPLGMPVEAPGPPAPGMAVPKPHPSGMAVPAHGKQDAQGAGLPRGVPCDRPRHLLEGGERGLVSCL